LNRGSGSGWHRGGRAASGIGKPLYVEKQVCDRVDWLLPSIAARQSPAAFPHTKRKKRPAKSGRDRLTSEHEEVAHSVNNFRWSSGQLEADAGAGLPNVALQPTRGVGLRRGGELRRRRMRPSFGRQAFSPSPGFAMRRAALILFTALPLTSCDRGSTDPEPFDPIGSLSFTYRGSITGTFSATGALEIPADSSLPSVTGAGAYPQQDQLALVASYADAPPHADLFTLLLGDVWRGGSFQIDPSPCAGGSPAECRVGFFLPEVHPSEWTATPDLQTIRNQGYLMITGHVTITSISRTRVKGSFRGTALRGSELNLQNTIAISNGLFDLPLRPR
jgi:hypothetical protein